MLTHPTASTMTFNAEHEVRMRQVRHDELVEAASRAGRMRAARTPLRRQVGAVLVWLGHRIGGTTAEHERGDSVVSAAAIHA